MVQLYIKMVNFSSMTMVDSPCCGVPVVSFSCGALRPELVEQNLVAASDLTRGGGTSLTVSVSLQIIDPTTTVQR